MLFGILLIELVISGFIGQQPALAAADNQQVARYITSTLKDKPVKKWDEVIAPQLARRDTQVAEAKAAQQAQQQAEAARVAEEAAQAAQAAPVATQFQPSQPVDTSDAKMFIYMHESGNNPGAVNASSGACGLGQALPCSKMGCSLSDYACQDQFFTSYMLGRYGSWENARAFWVAHSWW